VCNPDDLTHVYSADACGNPIEAETRCFSSKQCEDAATPGQAECRCPRTGELRCASSKNQFATSLVDDTYVVHERACSDSRDIDPDDIVETCGFGSVCFVDDYDGRGHTPINGGQAFCAQSVLDEQSPYQDFGCTLAFTEFMRYPTALEVDCRCRITSVPGSQENGGSGSLPANPSDFDVTQSATAHPKGAIVNCASPSSVDRHRWPVAYGEGPVFKEFNDGDSTWYGAEFAPDARELYSVILWGNSIYEKTASIVAWNVDTKDRRVVTGWLPDDVIGLQRYGSGYESPTSFVSSSSDTQPLTEVDTVRLGPDGNLYASSHYEIIRVDPDTGERTLVWRRQRESLTGDISATFGQCFRPDRLGTKNSLQLEKTSFTVGPNLEFYKGFRDVRGGNGVVRISADGTTCTVMSRWGHRGDPDPTGANMGVPAQPDIGTGPPLQNFAIRGMLHHDGAVWAVVSEELFRFDPSTGDYRRVDDTRGTLTVGHTSMFWDPRREVIWASGNQGDVFGGVIVDPKTGQKESLVDDSGMEDYPGQAILRSVYPGGGNAANTGGGETSNNNITQFGGVVVDPQNPDIAYGVNNVGGLIKMELSTFNNYIHSWGQH